MYSQRFLTLSTLLNPQGMAHITGGGLLDNLPRVLPDNLNAVVDLPSSGWELPPVFKWLQTLANLPQVRAVPTSGPRS
jgi:phosphoribosylformylglycinamidine cyclo-ligase